MEAQTQKRREKERKENPSWTNVGGTTASTQQSGKNGSDVGKRADSDLPTADHTPRQRSGPRGSEASTPDPADLGAHSSLPTQSVESSRKRGTRYQHNGAHRGALMARRRRCLANMRAPASEVSVGGKGPRGGYLHPQRRLPVQTRESPRVRRIFNEAGSPLGQDTGSGAQQPFSSRRSSNPEASAGPAAPASLDKAVPREASRPQAISEGPLPPHLPSSLPQPPSPHE